MNSNLGLSELVATSLPIEPQPIATDFAPFRTKPFQRMRKKLSQDGKTENVSFLCEGEREGDLRRIGKKRKKERDICNSQCYKTFFGANLD